MKYLFAKHYRVESDKLPVVLLAEPEAESRGIYGRHLSNLSVKLEYCNDIKHLPKIVRDLRPHIIVFNPMEDLLLSMEILAKTLINHPSVRIITIGKTIPDNYLNHFMSLGVSYHINRSFSRPSDLVTAVAELLEV